MKRFLAVLILFFGAFFLFAEEGKLKRHNVFVGVANFFVYDGMYGLITYGYSLDRNDLLKASFDFKYHESDRYESKNNSPNPNELSWSISAAWQRYLMGKPFRPYVGIGARYSSSYEEDRRSEETWNVDEERTTSITIPLGIDFALSESVGFGLETEILFSRREVEWDYWKADYEPDTGDYTEYSVEGGAYKFYIAFHF